MLRLNFLNLFLAFMSLLAACTSTAVPLADRLALPSDQPTLVYFFTDN